MKKIIRKVLTDPIFKTDYLVQIGGDVNSAIKEFAKRLGVDPWTVHSDERLQGHFSAYRGVRSGCLWFKHINPGIVAHECSHAVTFLFDNIKCTLNENSEELYSYYLEWLVTEVSSIKYK